jgi:hypothetical protein
MSLFAISTLHLQPALLSAAWLILVSLGRFHFRAKREQRRADNALLCISLMNA